MPKSQDPPNPANPSQNEKNNEEPENMARTQVFFFLFQRSSPSPNNFEKSVSQSSTGMYPSVSIIIIDPAGQSPTTRPGHKASQRLVLWSVSVLVI
ncbi:hypothetical protein EX30DRAFT_71929 [Ascodesmis nigricans]|uniref:Uncharacterized protein n=1 Tax=Ascodesmis nigricans TaxID=341454 RepID=A0A4S2MTT2_9PEZI|nr:hypothetical protein EX30DRAFT_71929 [Ascodesmis nigricans]